MEGGYDAVGMNCKKSGTTEIKAQMSSIRAKGCMLMIVCVISFDMNTPPWWREKVMAYYYTPIIHSLPWGR